MPKVCNVLYVHIPKTAGSTITHALSCKRHEVAWSPTGDTVFSEPWRITYKHARYKDIPDEAKAAFTFTFVRNPYDRAVSCWAFSKSRLSLVDCLRREFGFPIEYPYLFRPQSEWLDGVDFDFMGRYETLESDIQRIREVVHFPVARVGHFNKSEHEPWQKYYDAEPEAVDLVRELYSEDFERLGYEK